MTDIAVSNPDKTYYPGERITKADVVDYYARIAPRMLDHLRGRPLMLHRFPGGIAAQGFYQKAAPEHLNGRIGTATMEHSDGPKTYAVADDATALQELANYGTVAFHTWLSTREHPRQPDQMTFDLDPSPGASFSDVQLGAEKLKRLLERLGAFPVVKTTGSRGLHVTVPLTPETDVDEVHGFAKAVATVLAKHLPERLTVAARKQARGERVLIDYWRNAYGQTQVAPYSLRAKPGAPIAAPLTWEEALAPGMDPQRFTLQDIDALLEREPWEWRPVTLSSLKERLQVD